MITDRSHMARAQSHVFVSSLERRATTTKTVREQIFRRLRMFLLSPSFSHTNKMRCISGQVLHFANLVLLLFFISCCSFYRPAVLVGKPSQLQLRPERAGRRRRRRRGRVVPGTLQRLVSPQVSQDEVSIVREC